MTRTLHPAAPRPIAARGTLRRAGPALALLFVVLGLAHAPPAGAAGPPAASPDAPLDPDDAPPPPPGPPPRSDVPPGFEDLAGPETTFVDVYWAGLRLGQFRATFGQGRLRFEDPAAVVAKVPNVIGKAEVTQALTGDLDAHEGKVCGTRTKAPGCGRLEPEVAAILFDSSKYKVTVFVAPVFLSSLAGRPREYLDSPDTGLSLLETVQGSVYGSTGGVQEPTLALRSRTLLAFDASRLRADLSFMSRTDPRVDEAAAEHDADGFHFEAGLIAPHGTAFSSLPRTVSLSLSTPTDTLYRPRQAIGNDLVVLLARPSVVTILKDGRRYATREYDQGPQVLDTDSLPLGAYPVTLEIREEAGGEPRYEERFLIRTYRMPPGSHPLWLGELGFTFDGGERIAYARAVTLHRVLPWLGLGADVVGREDLALTAEPKLVVVTEPLELVLTGLVSSDLDWGLTGSLLARLGPVYASLYGRHVARHDPDTLSPVLPADGTSLGASAGLSLGPVSLNLQGSYQRFGDDGRLAAAGRLRWAVTQGRVAGLELLANADWSENAAITGSALLQLRVSLPHLLGTLAGGADYRDDDGAVAQSEPQVTPRARVDLQLDDGDWLDDEIRVRAIADRHAEQTDGHLDASYRGVLGELYAAVDRDLAADNAATRYFGSFRLSGAIDGDGALFGGRFVGDSALIVEVDAQQKRYPAGAEFAVTIRDQTGAGGVSGGDRRTLRAGERRIFYLLPYREYQVTLAPVPGPHFVDVDLAPRTVTLFPGCVETLTWDARAYTTVFGQAVTPEGRPVAGAVVTGGRDVTLTDDEGWFQVVVTPGVDLVLQPKEGAGCRVSLGAVALDESFTSVGARTCR
ncbi:MAG: CS1-pili formation C-terminal domain-containing protein [Myxococcales bacterium]|nr:CS1-pili formation C-terminal domain-containing protein [Myxococcales bacterium]MCB9732771.1 CS1-pili formation C-terminal domain-containing protein [Deltaproteobacteria bacterium]